MVSPVTHLEPADQNVQYETISDDQQLQRCCEEWATARFMAFDTEFVSEDAYRPELCLVQLAVDGKLYVIDPQTIRNLDPLWYRLAAPGHVTLVHAGREELRFSLRAIGQLPHQLFDVQIAAGLIGLEYPAAYSTLVSKLLQIPLAKGETRTNWRRRPLSTRQLEYALQDVLYLEQLHEIIGQQLRALGRESWLVEEMQAWQSAVEMSEQAENWRRIAGIAGLSPRSLAIVRELWRWREGEAQQRNLPPRRVLRDDLIVELARRQTAEVNHIHAVRGFERRNLQRHLPALSAHIEAALDLPDDQCPPRAASSNRPQLNLLGQFLTSALSSICRDARVAPSIVGTAQDVRDLVAYRLDLKRGQTSSPPSLATGWRAGVVGQVIDQLLDGTLAVQVTNPLDEQPLGFVRIGEESKP